MGGLPGKVKCFPWGVTGCELHLSQLDGLVLTLNFTIHSEHILEIWSMGTGNINPIMRSQIIDLRIKRRYPAYYSHADMTPYNYRFNGETAESWYGSLSYRAP